MTKIRASNRLADLLGHGTELLMSNCGKWVRLEFFNGNIVRSKPTGNSEPTVIPETTVSQLDFKTRKRIA